MLILERPIADRSWSKYHQLVRNVASGLGIQILQLHPH